MCWSVYLFLLQRYKLFFKPPNFFTLIYIYSKRKSSHQPSLMAVICPLPSFDTYSLLTSLELAVLGKDFMIACAIDEHEAGGFCGDAQGMFVIRIL